VNDMSLRRTGISIFSIENSCGPDF
jgi:hypothetical protein